MSDLSQDDFDRMWGPPIPLVPSPRVELEQILCEAIEQELRRKIPSRKEVTDWLRRND